MPKTSRPASDTDFTVSMPGVGDFRYGRRTFGDRIRIRAEFVGLTLGHADMDLEAMASIVASHKVLCVEAPAGWIDLEAIDSIDAEDVDAQVMRLYALLRDKEDSFRRVPRSGVQAQGQGAGANDGVLDSPALPAVAA